MYIREFVKVAPHRRSRVSYFHSLSEFANKALRACELYKRQHNTDSGYKSGIVSTVLPVIKNGWDEVLSVLIDVEEEAKRAFAPKRIYPYGYDGCRVSVDHFLVGKPCMAKPKKTDRQQPQFIRLFFVGEAMAGAQRSNFIHKCAMLLAYIRRAESRGQRVELFVGFGGYSTVFKDSALGCMAIAKVKGFEEHIHLQSLSAIGHPSLLRSLQFGWEHCQGVVKTSEFSPDPSVRSVGGCAIYDVRAYKEALKCFLTENQAESTTFICCPEDIDPFNQLARGV